MADNRGHEQRMNAVAPVITIDGPSGSGKGTIAQRLAEQLGWHLLDSGAIYRVLALAAEHHGVALDDENALMPLAAHLDVQFMTSSQKQISTILEGEDVSAAIRTEAMGACASKVAAYPRVREALLRRQRYDLVHAFSLTAELWTIIAGLLVWLPLAITIWVLLWILGLMDSVFQTLLGAATAVLPAIAALSTSGNGCSPGVSLPGTGWSPILAHSPTI